jgi:hypothetical protein
MSGLSPGPGVRLSAIKAQEEESPTSTINAKRRLTFDEPDETTSAPKAARFDPDLVQSSNPNSSPYHASSSMSLPPARWVLVTQEDSHNNCETEVNEGNASEDTAGDASEDTDDGDDNKHDFVFVETKSGRFGITKEQNDIVKHSPRLGEIVCVNALAGCGKTTTISILCYQFAENHPQLSILYLVFNTKNQTEAMKSNKFPKKVEIRTTHAFVLRHFFGTNHMNQLKPTNFHDLDDIADTVGRLGEVQCLFPNLHHHPSQLKKRARAIARCIRGTLQKNEASDKGQVLLEHVPWRAQNVSSVSISNRTKWKEKVPPEKYISWANEYFSMDWRRCLDVRNLGTRVNIPHDSC